MARLHGHGWCCLRVPRCMFSSLPHEHRLMLDTVSTNDRSLGPTMGPCSCNCHLHSRSPGPGPEWGQLVGSLRVKIHIRNWNWSDDGHSPNVHFRGTETPLNLFCPPANSFTFLLHRSPPKPSEAFSPSNTPPANNSASYSASSSTTA